MSETDIGSRAWSLAETYTGEEEVRAEEETDDYGPIDEYSAAREAAHYPQEAVAEEDALQDVCDSEGTITAMYDSDADIWFRRVGLSDPAVTAHTQRLRGWHRWLWVAWVWYCRVSGDDHVFVQEVS